MPAAPRNSRLHEEARRFLVPPPARQARTREGAGMAHARLGVDVALVYEAAADRSGTRVQVLVAAPHGEIRIGVVQRERQVADRVRQVDAGDAARARCAARTMRATSNACPVRNCTPGHSTSAISSPCAARQASMAASATRSSPARGASSMQGGRWDRGHARRAARRPRAGRRRRRRLRSGCRRAAPAGGRSSPASGAGSTVREFMATTSPVARAGEGGEARGEVLVIGNPRTPRMLVPLDAQARPVIEFLASSRSRAASGMSPSEWPHR